MGGKGRGRPRKYNDKYHEMWRRNQQRYYKRHRKVILYAMKHKISLDEARKRLKRRKQK